MSKETAVRFSEADRFGVRGKVLGVGKGDSRKTVRVNVEILRALALVPGEITEAQRLLDELATSYAIVKTADTFPLWNGKFTPDLTEADLPALEGKTFTLDPATAAKDYYEAKAAKAASGKSGGGFSGVNEKVFNRTAELVVAAKQKAKQPTTFKDGAEITGAALYSRYNEKGADGKLTAGAKALRGAANLQKLMAQAKADVAGKANGAELDI